MSQASERLVRRTPVPPSTRRVAVGEQLIAMVSPLLLIALWEGLVRSRILDARFFPAPSSIVGTFAGLIASGELLLHVSASLRRVLLGFLGGGVPALTLGLPEGLSRWARAALNPLPRVPCPSPESEILRLVRLLCG